MSVICCKSGYQYLHPVCDELQQTPMLVSLELIAIRQVRPMADIMVCTAPQERRHMVAVVKEDFT
jgi:hypothetical protein